ncbi:MAG: Ammonium transporter [uncultured Thermomicrobiales bacterium]|uniref:Ammonium transporter n=1 Tax=uncultured Thermomicrobiales bacterium TaxID=1645740 RepID=A0A6J4U9I5_9BACT|nr:MAG: Ammonium transporter [uncultured Thermomicrobiales bacterium]
MDALALDTGNTAWVLISAALVLIMTPALGFFYAGLVRRENVLTTIMHSFTVLAIVSVQWVLWGYSLAFSGDVGGIIGNLDWFAFNNVLPGEQFVAAGVPHSLWAVYQGLFAAITTALITGAFAERLKFKALIIFTLVWSTFVYSPVCHWVWAEGGWLYDFGALDFAGGTVVHISSGIAAVVAAVLVGHRVSFGKHEAKPHNLTYTVLGASFLWFGWFGFNAGSAWAADGIAANAFVVTNVAAAMGAISWVAAQWLREGKPSVLAGAAGAVAGLVGITPAAGFVTPAAAIVIGFGAGVLCYFGLGFVKNILRVDDALDVFAVHGIGGIWGALATGLFASATVNPGIGVDGLFYGNPGQLWTQFVAIVSVGAFSGVATFVILKAIDLTIGLRVTEPEESVGLDESVHGEFGYNLAD